MSGKIKHGMYGHPIYSSWQKIKQRTNSKWWVDHPCYTGVLLYPGWITFQGFLDEPPSGVWKPGFVVSRYNDIGNYEPTNCVWISRSENARQSVESRLIRMSNGEEMVDVARKNNIPTGTATYRVCTLGWSPDDAATLPVRKTNRVYRRKKAPVPDDTVDVEEVS
jgi:hypothetical protein